MNVMAPHWSWSLESFLKAKGKASEKLEGTQFF